MVRHIAGNQVVVGQRTFSGAELGGADTRHELLAGLCRWAVAGNSGRLGAKQAAASGLHLHKGEAIAGGVAVADDGIALLEVRGGGGRFSGRLGLGAAVLGGLAPVK